MAGKMPIKPFKLPSRMDQNAATSLWKNLESSIDEIYQKKNSDLSFETLYRFLFPFPFLFPFRITSYVLHAGMVTI
jgi:hypothetical protein